MVAADGAPQFIGGQGAGEWAFPGQRADFAAPVRRPVAGRQHHHPLARAQGGGGFFKAGDQAPGATRETKGVYRLAHQQGLDPVGQIFADPQAVARGPLKPLLGDGAGDQVAPRANPQPAAG